MISYIKKKKLYMVFLAGSNPARATINLMLMSRSFKKHPFTAVCCYFSNKKDKIIEL